MDVLKEAPLDPATGKLPLLRSAEQLDAAFWKESKLGRGMMEEVASGCYAVFLQPLQQQ